VAKESATNLKRGIFMAKTKLDANVKVELSRLTLDNATLTKEVEKLTEENKTLKRQNVQLSSVIETDLKSDLIVKITAKSDYKPSDLEELSAEQLQTIDETLSKAKGVDSVYKPIRAGTAGEKSARTTVGNLFGKSRKQILDMSGEF